MRMDVLLFPLLLRTRALWNLTSSIGGFADKTPVRSGEVELTDAPGIGIELNSDLYALFKTLL